MRLRVSRGLKEEEKGINIIDRREIYTNIYTESFVAIIISVQIVNICEPYVSIPLYTEADVADT